MAKNSKKDTTDLPAGFVPLSRKSVDGWYKVTEENNGNALTGFYRGSFNVPSQFKKDGKTVHKVELTQNGTVALVEDGSEQEMSIGDLIGVDEKGWLSALGDVEEGREIFIRCKGKGTAKKGMNAPWLFDLGVVPI